MSTAEILTYPWDLGEVLDNGGMVYNILNATYSAKGDGVTDDTAAIQAALNIARDAGGGTVYVPPGTYRLTSALQVYSRTTLRLAPGATMKRMGNYDNMIRNGASGTAGGYTANTGIMIQGGTWDANGTAYPSNVCAIAFGHCESVLVCDTTITNIYGYHHLEFNACRDATALTCRLLNLTVGSQVTEAIQIDLANNYGAFPWFGPTDNTTCDNALIHGCTFRTGSHGVGSHTNIAGYRHTNIRIMGCRFEDLSGTAVLGGNWQGVTVSGNQGNNLSRGVQLTHEPSTACNDLEIVGNTFRNLKRAASNGNRGVEINAASGARARNVVISGNTIGEVSGNGISASYTDGLTITGNTLHAIGTSPVVSCSGIIAAHSTSISIANNTLDGFNDRGIQVSGASKTGTVASNTIKSGVNRGISIQEPSGVVFSGITVIGNTIESVLGTATDTGIGIIVDEGCTGVTVNGNSINGTNKEGVLLFGAQRCVVVSNIIQRVSLQTNGGSHGIHLRTGFTISVQYNSILSNTVDAGTETNKPAAAVRFNSPSAQFNYATVNRFLGTFTSAAISDAGSNNTTTGNLIG